MDKELLEHAVINQLQADIEEGDFDALSKMLGLLIDSKKSREILIEYLSDTAKENWIEGKTTVRY